MKSALILPPPLQAATGAEFLALQPAGSLAASLDRASASFGITLPVSSGVLNVSALYIPAGTVVSNINFQCGNSGSSGVAHNWGCLLDANRNLLAISGDNTSANLVMNAPKAYPIANVASGPASSWQCPTSGLYYAGFMFANSGGSQPLMVGQTDPSTSVMGLPPILCGTSNGSLSTPSTFPTQFQTITVTTGQLWVWLT
jgi:hypothetical protein